MLWTLLQLLTWFYVIPGPRTPPVPYTPPPPGVICWEAREGQVRP